MFRLTSGQPAELKGTIHLHKPVRGLGRVTDISGEEWDIAAIWGGRIVSAARVSDLHPYYTDTSGTGYRYVSQAWHPYSVEVRARGRGDG